MSDESILEETWSILKAMLGLRTKEKPFSNKEMMPLVKNEGGYIPGPLDHLAKEQGLASDDPYQLGAKMEAWRRSGSKERKP